MNKKISYGALITLLLAVAFPCCRVSEAEKKLAPEHSTFLSQVRYIISKEEKRVFIGLPESERPRFIEDFWKRRDPDPDTPENEFKNDYFGRLAKAEQIFTGEGIAGWLTERGRVYILYGPPGQRTTTPPTGDFERGCREVWYYGEFPVVFVDPNCSGTFLLATPDLSRLESYGIARDAIRQIMPSQAKSLLDFNISLRKKKVSEESRLEALVVIEIPYRLIWLAADGDKLKTILELELELRDTKDNLRWKYKKTYEVVLTESELSQNQAGAYLIEVPIVVEKDIASLQSGKDTLQIVLRNTTGKEELRKVAEFRLEEGKKEE